VLEYFTEKPSNAHIYYSRPFINTLSLRPVSALKGLSSGSKTDIFQQQGQQNKSCSCRVIE